MSNPFNDLKSAKRREQEEAQNRAVEFCRQLAAWTAFHRPTFDLVDRVLSQLTDAVMKESRLSSEFPQHAIECLYADAPFRHPLGYRMMGIKCKSFSTQEAASPHNPFGGKMVWHSIEVSRTRLMQVDFVYDQSFTPRSFRCFAWRQGFWSPRQFSEECSLDERSLIATLHVLYQESFH